MAKETPDLPSADRHDDVARPGRAADLAAAERRREAVSGGAGADAAREPTVIETLLANLDDAAAVLFCASARSLGAALMLVLRQPMRVAMALITTMVFLGGDLRPARRALHRRVPGADLRRRGDGVHGLRDHAARRPRRLAGAALLGPAGSRCPGRGFSSLLGAIVISVWRPLPSPIGEIGDAVLRHRRFSVEFLGEYWLHFELTSVLLVAAVVAATCGHSGEPEAAMDRTQLLLGVAVALFALGLVGVIVRRNVLVMLMCMELMLNGVILSLVDVRAAARRRRRRGAGVPDLRRRDRRDRASRSRSCCCWCATSARSTSAPTTT